MFVFFSSFFLFCFFCSSCSSELAPWLSWRSRGMSRPSGTWACSKPPAEATWHDRPSRRERWETGHIGRDGIVLKGQLTPQKSNISLSDYTETESSVCVIGVIWQKNWLRFLRHEIYLKNIYLTTTQPLFLWCLPTLSTFDINWFIKPKILSTAR